MSWCNLVKSNTGTGDDQVGHRYWDSISSSCSMGLRQIIFILFISLCGKWVYLQPFFFERQLCVFVFLFPKGELFCSIKCSQLDGNGAQAKRTTLHDLYEKQGQSPWYDNLSRPVTDILPLIASGVRGVTSNPTVIQHCILRSFCLLYIYIYRYLFNMTCALAQLDCAYCCNKWCSGFEWSYQIKKDTYLRCFNVIYCW